MWLSHNIRTRPSRGFRFECSSRNPEHRFLSAQLLSGPLTFSFCVVRSSRTFFAHLSGVCVCLGSALPCEEGRLRRSVELLVAVYSKDRLF